MENNKDFLDKTKPLRMVKKEEITNEVLRQVKDDNVKLWVGNVNNKEIEELLGLNVAEPIKIVVNGDTIKHIENRHGVNSAMVQNGQPAVTNDEIIMHADFVNTADKRKVQTRENGVKVLLSGKQVNGYYIIVETISKKKNELSLKTLFKEHGKLENDMLFR